MSRAGRKTKRLKKTAAPKSPTASVIDFLYRRLTNPDLRSHAEYLRDMRAKQPVNPATAALLDRLKRVI
jgi:hypothetical protein